ncbi:pre-mRNA-processing protein 40A-like isoform X2 [Lotus japonicus]|uniref:pre-mRNA-processing protein 40A-like isoform X2 n=1 Tax=Lotus japonicus TaxID=34305 RepID=UPI0025898E19|nr:pre-mRNA-processing protein 40A-like isoform X2 [Lotus japonicus]
MSNNPHFPGLQPLRPPTGPVDSQRNFGPPMPVQFRTVVPAQQPPQFVPMPSQHYQPLGPGVPMMNVGMHPQNPQPQFSQPIQPLPPRPSQQLPLPSQPIPLPVARPNMQMSSESMIPLPDSQAPNGYAPGLGGPGMPLSSSYTFAPSSYGQVQTNFSSASQYQTIPQIQAHTGTSSQSITSGTILQSSGEQPSATINQPKLAKVGSSDWIEHTSATGRKFYYNKRTKSSSWEKPFELMTPIERVDASTNWKEFTSPDGRKYYYNKVTKESKWLIPEELKLAREQGEKAIVNGTRPEALLNSHTQPSATPSVTEATPIAENSSLTGQGEPSSPVSVAPVVTTPASNLQSELTSGSSASPSAITVSGTKVDELDAPVNTVTPSDASAGSDRAFDTEINTAMPTTAMNDANNISAQDTVGGVSAEDKEDGKNDSIGEKANGTTSEAKAAEPEPLVYANKMEAKDAFKALLESVNVGSDWTWDRAMRLIINDKRYGALKTLGDRKQAFNEYLNQRKKQEAEEKRMKQKKAREDFKIMLEESTELTSSTRWSKAIAIFENDERFKAVERDRDRKDMFDSFLEELIIKDRTRVQEERKRSITEYRKFLESCDFIKASTQWRKVQDRLEADERCSRLEKIDRLEIFQDYLRDLEKEEEEQKKIQKEELRKAERKNREDFRKSMEEHIASGILTAKTQWRDYYLKVKDLHAYQAVASNTSGSTPKDLFEDVAEELEKQYHEEKSRVKDALKLAKITLLSTWTFEDFQSALSKDISSPPKSEFNLKLVFDELQERAREKEEKEAKKRKRLADDFFHILYSTKDITASSKWEDSRPLVEDSQEFRSIGDESLCKDIFEEYITKLKEEAKEIDRKRKEERDKDREERERKKSKHRKEKEGGRERGKEETHRKDKTDSDSLDATETQPSNENKRSGGDNRKQRKQHQSPEDTSHEVDKERTKKSHGHSSDRKKSRRHASGHESDEGRHKRRRRDHRSDSHREGDYGDLEDGEFGDVADRW